MSPSLVELRPNRRLMDHEFEGYKLNLQTLPHFTLALNSPVGRLYPDELQYSFVHAKLFALHNHLVLDHWDYSFSYYYVDEKQQVYYLTFENTTQVFQSRVVYDVPAHVERRPGHFNLSISFPSSNLALVSDGTGYLHIVDTMSRNRPIGKDQMWQTLLSTLALEGKYFTIIDSRIEEKDYVENLHCLLQSVEQNDQHFFSVLTWVTFQNEGQAWRQLSTKQIEGKGCVHYACFETTCKALYIASDNPFKFTCDSERPIKNELVNENVNKIIYTWLQTSEDISLTLQLNEKFNKKLLQVNISQEHIKVSYEGRTFIDGKLNHKVDSDLTTWNIQENGQVDILITKMESVLWNTLLRDGDKYGEQIIDESIIEEAHKRLAHLCAETEVPPTADNSPGLTHQLEECDAASEENTTLVRLDAANHQITHRIPLSVNQYIFNTRIETQEVPAIVLRHDVDACIWQPYAQLINTDTWLLKHQGTLNAFGYVQSSKQNKKFVTCPPNFSYSVVCEATRHIFIYKNSSSQDCHLRKRTGGTVKTIKIGHQYLFNIDKYGEVLGINATNEFLFLLTQTTLVAIEIQ